VIGILEFKSFLASMGNSTGKITSAGIGMGKAGATGGQERHCDQSVAEAGEGREGTGGRNASVSPALAC
jgi:hypothetical protein